MLAEIKGKISQTGSNLSDRLEDKLTGDFFGTIRYLPFEIGLGPVLSKVRFRAAECDFLRLIEGLSGYGCRVDFWKSTDYGEPDVLISTENADFTIEVKYKSGLSSDDAVDNSEKKENEESTNQLYRYSKYMLEYSQKQHKYLLLLAPVSIGVPIFNDMSKCGLIQVSFGLLTWEDVLQALKEFDDKGFPIWQKMIIGDLVGLLEKKGFDKFKGFRWGIKTGVTLGSYAYVEESFQWPITIEVRGDLYYEYRE